MIGSVLLILKGHVATTVGCLLEMLVHMFLIPEIIGYKVFLVEVQSIDKLINQSISKLINQSIN